MPGREIIEQIERLPPEVIRFACYAQQHPADENEFAPAFYPGKEAWKNQPGNRYTPDELRAMHENWDVKVTNPRRPQVRSAD